MDLGRVFVWFEWFLDERDDVMNFKSLILAKFNLLQTREIFRMKLPLK